MSGDISRVTSGGVGCKVEVSVGTSDRTVDLYKVWKVGDRDRNVVEGDLGYVVEEDRIHCSSTHLTRFLPSNGE